MTTIFLSPAEILQRVCRAAKERRLSQNLTQQSLSERSGVSLGVVKKFERTGKISFESLLKLSLVLGEIEAMAALFKPAAPESFFTMDELLKQTHRKRGRL